MLPDPFEHADIAPLAKALMDSGRMMGRLQVYQELSTAMGSMLKANKEGADFDVLQEITNLMAEGIVETTKANASSVQRVIAAAKGQNDS